MYCMCQCCLVGRRECQHGAIPGAKGKDPGSKHPRWLNQDITAGTVIWNMLYFHAKELGNGETTHLSAGNPGACWVVTAFNSTFK